jgi:hypothetical protein
VYCLSLVASYLFFCLSQLIYLSRFCASACVCARVCVCMCVHQVTIRPGQGPTLLHLASLAHRSGAERRSPESREEFRCHSTACQQHTAGVCACSGPISLLEHANTVVVCVCYYYFSLLLCNDTYNQCDDIIVLIELAREIYKMPREKQRPVAEVKKGGGRHKQRHTQPTHSHAYTHICTHIYT